MFLVKQSIIIAMNKATKIDKIPENSRILNNFGNIDYFDTYQINIKTDDNIDVVTTGIFTIPIWVKYLLRIRDCTVGMFGLKTGDNNLNIDSYYPIGSKAVYFNVLDRNDNEIVMAENDKHLNFRTSVFIERNDKFSTIYLTTIVQFNNLWGRLYFIPVKPFHRLIIISILNKYLMNISSKRKLNNVLI
jgi:hypothetical protein